MNKNILKVAVLVVIGVFVLQIIGMAFLQGSRSTSGDTEDHPSDEIYVIQGTTNVTVSSYSSSITISGNLSNLKEIKNEFIENGWFDSETYISNNETIFNLKNSDYTKNVSNILIENDFLVSTGVNLKFPDKLGNMTLGETYRIIETSPIYNIGDQIMVEFGAYAQNNQIIQLAGFDLVPYNTEITLDALVDSIRITKFNLYLEDIEKQELITNKYNITFVNSTSLFTVENPNEEYTYISNILNETSPTLEIDQTLGVILLPSEKEGVYESINFVVHSSKLNSINDTIQVKINAVLDKGKVNNIIDYEIIYE